MLGRPVERTVGWPTCPCLTPRFERESVNLKEADIKKSRFTEAQIIGMLREQEAGGATAGVLD